MNILYFLDSDLSKKNAEYVHVSEVVTNLEKLGNEIYLVAPRTGDININIKNTILIPTIKNPIHLRVLFYQLISPVFVLFLILNKDIDIIYIRQGGLSLLPELAGFITKRPVISELNGISFEETKRKPEFLVKNTIRIFEKLVYRFSNRFVAVTDGTAEYLKQKHNIPGNMINVINNGANTDLFQPMDVSKCREQLGLSQNDKIICFIGNLAPWQGINYLIKAAPQILTECSNTRFLIVGDGAKKKEWMILANNQGVFDKFIFVGGVSYEKVPTYINASDICVSPFDVRKIGSPMKVYEYLACGKAVVSSNLEGVADLLEKSEGGIIVKPEDSREFANNIINLIKDEKLRDDMGRKGRSYIVKNHSWKAVAKRVEKECLSVFNQYK